MSAVIRDAASEGLSTAAWRAVLWLPVVGSLLLGAVYVVNRRSFYWLLLEDHPVEWAQFALLAFAGATASAAAVRLGRQGRWGLAALLVLLALGTLGLAAEEISWGQRVFGLAVPTQLGAANKQHELNVHNLTLGPISVDSISEVVELALGAAGVTVALVVRAVRGPARRTWLRFIAPPLVAVPGAALMAVYQVFMLLTKSQAAPAIAYQEMMELCLDLSIALTAISAWRRAGAGIDAERDAAPLALRSSLSVFAVAALVLTGAFAALTAHSRVVPGNVPPSLVDLYLEAP